MFNVFVENNESVETGLFALLPAFATSIILTPYSSMMSDHDTVYLPAS